ncbi:bacillithiol system redox-active protein YtxJ [Microaerobacter geothermalis]|uniref:bacillithiol system redox-active protein YtxJ n=1 Tax=Microaerobacter geothermalis TaxID=674972 RepID=UPI001F2D6E1E|nr:bacillithiol system redox-active protein YtxJ [Microaerobacter geothermalis]MCF6093054.1 bacillithiol system redox-active protein YtxJ [Microaerobacter geothermalis]
MSHIRELVNEIEFMRILEKSHDYPVFVLKHSTRCPISAKAYQQYEEFARGYVEGDLEFTLVKVIEARPVSNLIAEKMDIMHQSPQLILLKNGEAVWNDSHYGITFEKMEEIVNEIV